MEKLFKVIVFTTSYCMGTLTRHSGIYYTVPEF